MFDLSLEELMNIKIGVSKTDLSIRETPAVLSVITRKEIQNMGGVYDIFNEQQSFIQPFASGHAPLPGLGREFSIRLAYTIPFGKN